MKWLPSPIDFAQRLKASVATDDPGERAEKLAALAQTQLSFVETVQLDNALKARPIEPVSGFSEVRLAVLASSTIDHLLPAIRVAGLRRRLAIQTYTPSFGQYRQTLFDAASPMHAFRPDIVLLSITCFDAIAGISVTASREEAEAAIARTVTDLRELWRRAREDFGAAVIQQSFLDITEPLFGSFDRLVPGAPARLVARLNDLLVEAIANDGVMLLDAARSSARDGINFWFDIARWLQGKIEISPQAATGYGDLVASLVAAQRGQSKKCLVLDLDNTLWGGVVGDVGPEGITLGQGSATGEAHLSLQRYAKSLKERGIMLAVCSKNEMTTAETVFRDHPEMALRRSDMAAFMVNWADKAENLRSIAEQLNIGLDSLVFVDDNPVERARIRESLPMVAVPELPDDPVYYVRCVAEAGYFEAVSFTTEDRDRAAQYAANLERESLRSTLQSMDDFLSGLEMHITWGAVTAVDLGRAVQLINKTNQFNTTTRRVTNDELLKLVAAAESLVLQFRLVDRFGDNGIVSVMILCQAPEEPAVFEIVNWVMSCRVFGRQLEDEIMNIAVEELQSRGARTLRAEFIPTPKNAVITDLYKNLRFSRIQTSTDDGASSWALSLPEYETRPTSIARKLQA